jgi:putative ABC transport system permease protein
MENERIWLLFARKLAGEISPEELHELDDLLEKNPDIGFSFEILSAYWKTKGQPEQDREYEFANLLRKAEQEKEMARSYLLEDKKGSLFNQFINVNSMFQNYFKTAFRNFARHKVFAMINIVGLTVGITACLLIYLYTSFEMSFDSFHPDKKRIYRLVSDVQISSGEKFSLTEIIRPQLMSGVIRKELTGIETEVVLDYYYAKTTIPDGSKNLKKFERPKYGEAGPDKIIIAEPQYFSVFRYEWLAGDQATALSEPFKVVLTESKAQKYFGQVPADQVIGRELIYDDSLHVRVSGIVKDWNKNTDLNFSDFISSSTVQHSFLGIANGNDNWQVYVKLTKGVTPAQVESGLAHIIKVYLHPEDVVEKIKIRLEPLTDMHFNEGYARDPSFSRKAHLPTLYGLMAIAAFILLIAAINFINLTTAKSLQRSKEIGIRKVLGSSRAGLVLQFLTETFLLTGIAAIVSLLIANPLLETLRTFIPKGVALRLSDPFTWIFLLVIIVFTALIAGFYPAKVLSAYTPALSLKGQTGQLSDQKNYLRKGLIIFQFTFSLVFIIGSIIVGGQIKYLLNKDLGLVKDAIITINTDDQYPEAKKIILAEKIRQLPGIDKLCFDRETPAVNYLRGGNLKSKEKGIEIFSEQRDADENYIPLYGLKIIAGRNFKNPANDAVTEFIVNETCARQLGFPRPQDAIGQFVVTEFSGKIPFRIAGVVADFHSKPLLEPIKPIFIIQSAANSPQLSIKLSTLGGKINNFQATIAAIEKIWKEIYPGEKFEYRFFDDTIAKFYEKEQQTAQIMNLAMGIAIFVSCIGLFGLVSFNAEQRTREIGIRKVLGASVSGIVLLLSKDYLKLVLIAILISSPIAWYFMYHWLQNFAYRINISWWVFAVAAILSLLIAILTISFRAIKAAIANPIKSLRTE